MFRKISIVFWCCFLPLFALAQETPSADLQVVAFSNPLLQYPENGEHKGPTNEILKGLLKTTQLSANIAYMPWARAFSKAINTPNTLILSIFRTPERENSFHWIIKVSQAARVFISLQSKTENQRMSYIALNKKSNKNIVKLLQKAADQYSKTPEYEYFLNK